MATAVEEERQTFLHALNPKDGHLRFHSAPRIIGDSLATELYQHRQATANASLLIPDHAPPSSSRFSGHYTPNTTAISSVQSPTTANQPYVAASMPNSSNPTATSSNAVDALSAARFASLEDALHV